MSTMSDPEKWDLKKMIEKWHAHLKEMISKGKSDLPFERLCFQSQTDSRYGQILKSWSTMG